MKESAAAGATDGTSRAALRIDPVLALRAE